MKHIASILTYLFFIFIIMIVYPQTTLATTDFEQLEHELTDYIEEHEESIAGLSTIVISPDRSFYKVSGYADIEKEIPIADDSVFEWGSISKVLIWISVLQLVERGDLQLDEDIHTYLPKDFKTKRTFDEPLTIQDLMNHSGGFDDSYTDLMVHNPKEMHALKEVLQSADITQVYPPNQVVAYSNYGATLAAYLVEELSGMSFADYVRENIFIPLEMTETGFNHPEDTHSWVKEERKNIQGYTVDLKLVEPNEFLLPMYPAGGLIGTSLDLEKLLVELLSEDGARLFKKSETIDLLFEPSLYYPNSNIPRIANGLFYLPSQGGKVYGHGGNTLAFTSSLYMDREAGLGVIVLTNQANEEKFTLGIPELVLGSYLQEKSNLMEASSHWEGIYQPIRLPHDGFSKLYGLFLRGKVKSVNTYDLMTNGVYYSQLEPGVYVSEDSYSAYALDLYSEHFEYGKVLSSSSTDLIHVPYFKHILDWTTLVLLVLALFLSLCFIVIWFLNIIRGKRPFSLLFISQHVLNMLFMMNVFFIAYLTLSMTTYSLIRPLLYANVLFIISSIIISSLLLIRLKHEGGKLSVLLTIFCSIIFCGAVFYWDFYY